MGMPPPKAAVRKSGFPAIAVRCWSLLTAGWVGVSAGWAETLFVDHSLSLLRGERYELGESGRTMLTYEHLSLYSWGDLFGFSDMQLFDDGSDDLYLEVSPSVTLAELDRGFIKAFKAGVTMEAGRGFAHGLLGGGVDLNIPGFQVFAIRGYRRLNASMRDNWQLTSFWSAPFRIGQSRFLFDGFFDATSKNHGTATFHAQPQLKWDVSHWIGQERKLYLGMEYIFWRNKYGVAGVDEHNPNLLLRYHF